MQAGGRWAGGELRGRGTQVQQGEVGGREAGGLRYVLAEAPQAGVSSGCVAQYSICSTGCSSAAALTKAAARRVRGNLVTVNELPATASGQRRACCGTPACMRTHLVCWLHSS